MTRLTKVLGIVGFASVYLMQGACTLADGLSIIPTITTGHGLLGYILPGA